MIPFSRDGEFYFVIMHYLKINLNILFRPTKNKTPFNIPNALSGKSLFNRCATIMLPLVNKIS